MNIRILRRNYRVRMVTSGSFGEYSTFERRHVDHLQVKQPNGRWENVPIVMAFDPNVKEVQLEPVIDVAEKIPSSDG